jgi:predicted porin
MNKNIKLAVAGAVLALSASAANAGIIIPAGEWTLDINGNVNAYATSLSVDRAESVTGDGGVAGAAAKGSQKGINTGLLPAWLGFTGKTRQNDLDVEFTISIQPGVSENSYHGDGSNGITVTGVADRAGGAVNATVLNRQTYVSFGDKSWGSIKLGKDLGIYASDAILNDMTLLGVGGAAHLGSGSAINTTTGGIGTGYQYAAWKGQVAYTTPNFNGFQATVGIVNPNMFGNSGVYQDRFGMEGKASYSFAGDTASGKVWISGASYDVDLSKSDSFTSTRINAYDLGATVNIAGFGLTAYGYDGRGNGSTALGLSGLNSSGKKRDGNGGYIQATYILPSKTKVGVAYGESKLELAQGETVSDVSTLIESNERVTVGLYHPLTKHLNLVGEYNDIKGRAHNGNRNEYDSVSLGAILFF